MRRPYLLTVARPDPHGIAIRVPAGPIWRISAQLSIESLEFHFMLNEGVRASDGAGCAAIASSDASGSSGATGTVNPAHRGAVAGQGSGGMRQRQDRRWQDYRK